MDNENTNNPDEKRSLKDDFDDSATPNDFDDSKVKFLNGKNEPHVVVEVTSDDVSFSGLGKEELMKYATDPFWVRIRYILFAIFWIGWVAMLAAAIIIIILAPRCPERPDLKWYQTDVLYQVNPKSFKDSSLAGDEGAGTGDISGLSSKVGYLQSLGVNTIWINSIYKSGGLYDGNDVEDHTKVDELFGTMSVLDRLRKVTKKKGMKMVMDFIPNHTGKKHEWFIQSQAKDAEFADYYIWEKGSGSDPSTNPPNNWVTVYDTPAWTYDSTRGEWYYHSYLPEYPDLNLRNKDVLAKLDGVLKFWLDKGVDGFVIQGLQRLVEMNDTSKDETPKGHCTTDQKENLDLVKRWRGIIDSYSTKPGRERALLANVAHSGNNTADYYKAGIQVISTDALVNVADSCNSECLKDKLLKTQDGGYWRGWMVNNENSPRFGSTVKKELQMAYQVLQMLLPGTAFVYYGDEIAMVNGVVTVAQQKDPLVDLGKDSRDPFRTPMLWNDNYNAGFCARNVTPWLPVNQDYASRNVEYNKAHMIGYTTLSSFKDLVQLRSKESFQWGALDINVRKGGVLTFTRKAEGYESYLVAINLGGKSVGINEVADSMTLVYDSEGTTNVGTVYNTRDSMIGFSKLGEVYVFKY